MTPQISELPDYEPEFRPVRKVGAGPNAITFQVSANLSAKFQYYQGRFGFNHLRKFPSLIEEILEEVLVAEQMHKEGIPVIYPQRVCNVRLSTIRIPETIWTPKSTPAIIMPYVKGTLLEQVSLDRQPALFERASNEVEKRIKKAGFVTKSGKPYDFPANTIITEDDKMYFIGLNHFNPKR